MIRKTLPILFAILFTSEAARAAEAMRFDNGWVGLTEQTDPFDRNALSVRLIFKGDVSASCSWINLRISESSYDSFNFEITTMLKIDDDEPVEQKGRWGTYHGTSDLVNDERYINVRIPAGKIERLKASKKIAIAGKIGNSWNTEEINMKGFGAAYSRMCD